jgi:hypothetical protein
MASDERWIREIECWDRSGRDRPLIVTIDDISGQLAIGTPPDGYGVVTHLGGDLLKAAIDEGQRLLVRRGVPMSGGSGRQVFTVQDVHGSHHTFAINLDRGRVVWHQTTKTASADPDVVRAIGVAFLAKALELADEQRRRGTAPS